MADYLQDLLDRAQSYMDPGSFAAYDPTQTDEENKKKKPPTMVGAPPPVQPDMYAGMLGALGGIGLPPPPDPGQPPQTPPMQVGAPQGGATPISPIPGFGAPLPTDTSPPPQEPDQPIPPDQVPLPKPRPTQASGRQREASGEPAAGTEGAQDPRAGQAGQTRLTQGQGGPVQMSAADQAVPQAGMLGGLGDLGGNIMSGLSKHSNMLMALGAGLLGAPNLAQGFSRGLSYAVPAAQADIRQQLQMGGQQGMYSARKAANVPENLARAGATDPKIGQKLLDTYITGRAEWDYKPVETTNSWGEKSTRIMATNKYDPSQSHWADDPNWQAPPTTVPGGGAAPAAAIGGAPVPAGTTMATTARPYGGAPAPAAPAGGGPPLGAAPE